MNTRFVPSAPLGFLITAGLLLLMQTLVATGPEAYTKPRPRVELGWLHIDPPEFTVDEPQTFDKPEPPKEPPRPDNRWDAEESIHVPEPTAQLPRKPEYEAADFGQNRGPLVDVMYVRPVYPAEAAARGLEGYVTVKFDVTEMGTVANVTILESTHRVFEKPAREAALRSRFRPQIVDGVAIATKGLVRRYRFELEE